MSTDYRFKKEITFEQLFDGCLKRYGINEEIVEGQTSPNSRLLTDGKNGVWVHGDEVVSIVKRCGTNDPGNILNAITNVFDTHVFSEHEPQFWGYKNEEEWANECP